MASCVYTFDFIDARKEKAMTRHLVVRDPNRKRLQEMQEQQIAQSLDLAHKKQKALSETPRVGSNVPYIKRPSS